MIHDDPPCLEGRAIPSRTCTYGLQTSGAQSIEAIKPSVRLRIEHNAWCDPWQMPAQQFIRTDFAKRSDEGSASAGPGILDAATGTKKQKKKRILAGKIWGNAAGERVQRWDRCYQWRRGLASAPGCGLESGAFVALIAADCKFAALAVSAACRVVGPSSHASRRRPDAAEWVPLSDVRCRIEEAHCLLLSARRGVPSRPGGAQQQFALRVP